MQGTISGLIASYGYVVLFFLIGLESLGVPLPGEAALVTAAAFAALGRLSIYGVVATAVAAAIIGDNGGYWIGRAGGSALGDPSLDPPPERTTLRGAGCGPADRGHRAQSTLPRGPLLQRCGGRVCRGGAVALGLYFGPRSGAPVGWGCGAASGCSVQGSLVHDRRLG